MDKLGQGSGSESDAGRGGLGRFAARAGSSGPRPARRPEVLRSPRFWGAVAASFAWIAIGGICLRWFYRSESAVANAVAAFILWPGKLFDFYSPDFSVVPGARGFLFVVSTLAWYLLVLLPVWQPRLAGLERRIRNGLLIATLAAHVVLSLVVLRQARLLFELDRIVREL